MISRANRTWRLVSDWLRATVARSKAALQAEPYETDDLCTPADIVRWTTIPDEYDIEPKKNPCRSPLG